MSDNPYLCLNTRDECLFWVFTQTCIKEMMSRMRSYIRILPGNHFSLWYTFWWYSVGFCLISGFQAYENHIARFDFKRSPPNYINSKALLPHKFQETLKEIPNTIDLGVLITTAGNLICSLISFSLSFPSLCLHKQSPKAPTTHVLSTFLLCISHKQPLFMRMSLFGCVLDFFLFPASGILLGREWWSIKVVKWINGWRNGRYTAPSQTFPYPWQLFCWESFTPTSESLRQPLVTHELWLVIKSMSGLDTASHGQRICSCIGISRSLNGYKWKRRAPNNLHWSKKQEEYRWHILSTLTKNAR